jgi:hypothetical protein
LSLSTSEATFRDLSWLPIRHETLRETFTQANFISTLLLVFLWGTAGDVLFPARCQAAEPQLVPAGTLDPYAAPAAQTQPVAMSLASDGRWCFDLLPDGLIYRPYLAGPKESRTGLQFVGTDDDWKFDTSIGGHWGLLRFGTQDPSFPKGWQLDLEASAQFRNRGSGSLGILTSDVRFGVPLSFSRSNHQTKFGLYFLRAHPSDRLIDRIGSLSRDGFFQRKSFVLGHSVYLTNRFRLYGELGYAVSSTISEPWELQFGTEYAPVCPTGLLGSPFIAANGYLREEVNFGGTFTLQAGWAWRKKRGRLLRIGMHYANGMSNQFALHDQHEQQLGFGIWHDF